MQVKPKIIKDIESRALKINVRNLKLSLLEKGRVVDEYIVINTETEEYVTHHDKEIALKNARRRFGEKEFYISKIGDFDA